MNKFKNILKDKFIDLKIFIKSNRRRSVFLSLLLISFSVYLVANAFSGIDYFHIDGTPNFEIDYQKSDVVENELMSFGTLTYNANFSVSKHGVTDDTNTKVRIYVWVQKWDKVTLNGFTKSESTSHGQDFSNYDNIYFDEYYKEVEIEAGNQSLNFTMSNCSPRSNDIFMYRLGVGIYDQDKVPYQEFENSIKITNENPAESYLVRGTILRKQSGAGDPKGYALIPIGIVTLLPYNDTIATEASGIKGYKNVQEVSHNLQISINGQTENDYGFVNNFNKWSQGDSGFEINGIPYIEDNNNQSYAKGNNTVTVSNITIDPSITLEHLNISDSTNYNSKSVVISSSYSYISIPESSIENDENLTINVICDGVELPITINYKPTIGPLSSDVSFDSSNSNTDTSLNSVYGNNVDFTVTNKYASGEQYGDTLNGMTTYVKLDENLTNVKVNRVKINGVEYPFVPKSSSEIRYYYAPWNEMTTSYISDKEDVMGYAYTYNWGPILTYSGGIDMTKIISSNEGEDNANLVAVRIGASIPDNSEIKIELSGKIKDNASLVGTSLPIITNSVTVDENNDDLSLVDPSNSRQNLFCKPEVCGSYKNGNYIHILPGVIGNIDSKTYKETTKEDVELNKTNNVLEYQNEFYAGKDEPIVWNFKAGVTKGSSSNVSKVDAYVTIPKETNNYEYLSLSSAFITRETSNIFGSGSEESSDYNEVLCSRSDEGNCRYELIENTSVGEKRYHFTITGQDEIESFIANGIFIKTNIEPIAVTSEVKLNFDCDVTFGINDTSYSSSNSTEATTNIKVIRSKIANSGLLQLEGSDTKSQDLKSDLNQPYYYYMNSVIGSTEETGKNNYEIITILPHNTDTEINFHGTYGIEIQPLPEGYTAYYLPKGENDTYDINAIKDREFRAIGDNILTSENTLAIKIKLNNPNSIRSSSVPMYFGGQKDSIKLKITPNNNQYGDKYDNSFYMYTDKLYDSKVSVLSTFNRSIKGYAFEDFNYDGFYSLDEQKIENLPVELYKISQINEDGTYTQGSELVGEVTKTSEKGYEFTKLDAGNYYIKIVFDNEQYKITDFNKDIKDSGGEYIGNSKFVQGDNENEAITEPIELNSSNSINRDDINLGLKLQNSFSVSIDKYIKNIKIKRGDTIENRDYDHEKQVKLDFRDLNNTSFEVTYGFDVKNTKYFPGYVGTIVEAIPEQMVFDPSDPVNVGWESNSNLLYYKGLAETLIMPKQTYSFEIKLTIPENMAGDFINVITAGDLRILETTESPNSSKLETKISTLGIIKEESNTEEETE